MDIGLEYVKMCEQAKEIQEQAPVVNGEYDYSFSSPFYLPEEEEVALFHYDNDEGRWMIGGYHQEAEGAIWLPRQDQLLGMLYGKDYSTKVGNIKIPEKTDMWSILPSFFKWAYNWEFNDNFVTLTKANEFQSMEQLWLAFVMSERYKKVWDGTSEEWVEILEGIRV